MAGPLSTDDGSGPSNFDSLEARIVHTDRDHDREVRTSIRPTKAQLTQIEKIKNAIGTNKVEIHVRAYNAGLSELRTIDFVDRSTELRALNNAINDFVASSGKYWAAAGEKISRFGEYGVELGLPADATLLEPDAISVQDSVVSEVRDRLLDDMSITGSAHRHIITIGLSESQYSRGVIEERRDSYIQDFDDALTDSRELCEERIALGINGLYPIIESEGIGKENYQTLVEVSDLMKTEHITTIDAFVGMVEDNCEIR